MENKIFVGGTNGSGKTTFVQNHISKLQYVDFDRTFDMNCVCDFAYVQNYLNKLPERFIIDNIPWVYLANNVSFEPLSWYLAGKDYSIIITVCSNPIEWLNRMFSSNRILGVLDVSKITDITKEIHLVNSACLEVFYGYAYFYYTMLQFLDDKYLKYKIFDSFTDEFITKEELYRRIDWSRPALEVHGSYKGTILPYREKNELRRS